MIEIINQQNRTIHLQAVLLILLTLILVGASFNHVAVKNNEGKMPVLEENDYQWETEDHVSYQNKSEIENPFFSDRFSFLNYVCSIGDFFMIVSGIIWLVVCILAAISHTKSQKLIENKFKK